MQNTETPDVGSPATLGDLGLFIPPPMTAQRYASLQGLTEDTVANQIKRGQIPTIKVGKRRLVNTFALARKCLEG